MGIKVAKLPDSREAQREFPPVPRNPRSLSCLSFMERGLLPQLVIKNQDAIFIEREISTWAWLCQAEFWSLAALLPSKFANRVPGCRNFIWGRHSPNCGKSLLNPEREASYFLAVSCTIAIFIEWDTSFQVCEILSSCRQTQPKLWTQERGS